MKNYMKLAMLALITQVAVFAAIANPSGQNSKTPERRIECIISYSDSFLGTHNQLSEFSKKLYREGWIIEGLASGPSYGTVVARIEPRLAQKLVDHFPEIQSLRLSGEPFSTVVMSKEKRASMWDGNNEESLADYWVYYLDPSDKRSHRHIAQEIENLKLGDAIPTAYPGVYDIRTTSDHAKTIATIAGVHSIEKVRTQERLINGQYFTSCIRKHLAER